MSLLKVILVLPLLTCLSSLSIGQAFAGIIVTTFDVEITASINDFGAFSVGDSYSFQFTHDDSVFPQINRYDDGADGIANTDDDFFSEVFLPEGYADIDGADEFDLLLNPFQALLDDWTVALTKNSAIAKDFFDQNTRYVVNGAGINGSAAGYTSDSIDLSVGAYDAFQGASFNAFYIDSNMNDVMAQIDFKLIRLTVVPESSTLAIFSLGLMALVSRRFMKNT